MTSQQLTLTARVDGALPPRAEVPRGLALRPCTSDLVGALADLYWEAYDPGVAAASLDEARADLEASFAGEYGPLWPEASPVLEQSGSVVAAVLTVRSAPWDDVPPGPFVIELMTARSHRRRGLARLLMLESLHVAADEGASAVGLRVDSGNLAALSLYTDLGFRPVDRLG